jgi:hypothetical protein
VFGRGFLRVELQQNSWRGGMTSVVRRDNDGSFVCVEMGFLRDWR